MRFPGFAAGTFDGKSRILAGERCVNYYPADVAAGGKTRAALIGCPGLPDFASIVDSPGRGIFAEEHDRLFAVFGSTLNEIDENGLPTVRGAVELDGNPATMATNGNDQLLVNSGSKGRILDLNTNVLSAIVVNDITMCASLDTFLIGLDSTTGTLKISEASDGMTWDPGQIAQRSAAPDPFVSFIVCAGEIYLWGRKTGEVWFNEGGSTFPLALRGGSGFEVGIAAIFSVAPFGTTMAWLGRSARGAGQVFWMNGYTPNVISNEALEWAIETYKETVGISDAIGWSYEKLGHSFYVLEFPAAGKTWIYDAKTNQWHERGLWSPPANDFVPYRARFHAAMFDKNLVCDSQAGKIYRLASSVYTDIGGAELRRLRRLPHLSDENRQHSYDYFELEYARGVGTVAAGQGFDPVWMLRFSEDGGMTYGNVRTEHMGKAGDYLHRARWDRFGTARDGVFELSVTDPVPADLFDAYLGIS